MGQRVKTDRHVRNEIGIGDPSYPNCLRDLSDPPKTLYVIGDIRLFTPGLAVIGARRATPYGLQSARRFAGWAAACGVTVVSGAAIGCDRAAQLAARETDGHSIAVLGCGADVDYPAASRELLADLRRNCAVVSELPWGTPPTRWAFAKRNRIIAALSAAVLVVEAGLPSGTFSTADFALDIGRDVMAVPGSINHPESRGANRLIRQGATPITDVSELGDALRQAGLALDRECRDAEARIGNDPLERALTADAMRPDDLARALECDIMTVARRLGELEMVGLVVRYRDGRYGLNTTP
ncbi:MAG: DNA-protecting protein DprA [Actinobacteria bacterium HGW-Actinobacteria-6]|jgi:DNA processing protein|nr:MAG: DNA-protecting protein DprA [Actinobacteria bacterium HGW-Actinobacteria-6]